MACQGRKCASCGYTGKFISPMEQESNERYTPSHILGLVRDVLGTIDTDPASCEIANRKVKSKQFYTSHDNGLIQDWNGTVFCNPPYGRIAGVNGGYQALFVKKAIEEYQKGNASEIILLLLGNILFTTASDHLWAYDLCMWQETVRFYDAQNNAHSYGFGIVLVYMGPCRERFHIVFSPHGHIISGNPGYQLYR